MRSRGANVLDPVVHVFFDTHDRAVWIVPSNIEGLREKGSPSQSRRMLDAAGAVIARFEAVALR